MHTNHVKSGFALFAVVFVAAMVPDVSRCQSNSMEDLVQRADVVIVGKVTDVTSRWNEDRSRIYTNVTLVVDQQIKGTGLPNSVIIQTPGGEVDDVGEVYSHTARFKTDEQVVVFAATDRQGQLQVLGGDEGKLTLTTDEATGLQMVADKEPLTVFTSRLRTVVEAQSTK